MIDVLVWNKYTRVVMQLAERLNISPEKALHLFYNSKVYALLLNKQYPLITLSDAYITDENGNTYSALNDDTHHLGHTLEQHDLEDADGNTVTITETTNGDYYFRDENGIGFTDNGDGTWSDENGNSYTEMN